MHQKTKGEFCVEMLCLREVIFHLQASTKLRHFRSLIIIANKSFENSIENILNHPYLYSIYVSCITVTLNFFLFEPKFVLVLRLTRLSSSRRLAFIPQA